MSSQQQSAEISFTPINNHRLVNLCGPCNEHLQQIEQFFGVEIYQRGNVFHITGYPKSINCASHTLDQLYQATTSGLKHATHIINEIKNISVTHFDAQDVIRHPLVSNIIQAYDNAHKEKD